MGGQVSEDTIIDGEPHFVVWKDGTPVQAFPAVEGLADQARARGLRRAPGPDPAAAARAAPLTER